MNFWCSSNPHWITILCVDSVVMIVIMVLNIKSCWCHVELYRYPARQYTSQLHDISCVAIISRQQHFTTSQYMICDRPQHFFTTSCCCHLSLLCTFYCFRFVISPLMILQVIILNININKNHHRVITSSIDAPKMMQAWNGLPPPSISIIDQNLQVCATSPTMHGRALRSLTRDSAIELATDGTPLMI